MKPQCSEEPLEFHGLGRREVIGDFDGGQISSDGGALLLREVEYRTGICKRLAQRFEDHRESDLIEHRVEGLVKQRVMGIALGYADLNDHDHLRSDPLLGLVVDKADPQGLDRARPRDQGKALAGKSTLNRLELTPWNASPASRYKKIVAKPGAIDALFVEFFLEAYAKAPKRIWLDLDATDDPLHGQQEGRFFHGYYGHYCYLPLYIFCGEDLLCARLRESNIDGCEGAVEELERIVGQIRRRWSDVEIVVRGDSGFCREELMSWCEANGVGYVFGVAKNARLERALAEAMAQAKGRYLETGEAAAKSWATKADYQRDEINRLQAEIEALRAERDRYKELHEKIAGHFKQMIDMRWGYAQM